jgi:ribosomal protein S8
MRKFLVVLLLAAAALVGLGFYLGWFNFSTHSQGEAVDLSLKVNKDKIQQDTETATEKAKELGKKAIGQGQKVQDPANRKTVKGQLADVNNNTGMIMVSAKDGPLSIRVTDKTVIEREGKRISLNDVTVGEVVTVAYTTQENEQVAESVTVESK